MADWRTGLVSAMAYLAASAAAAGPRVLYVAPDGDDSAEGTSARPMATPAGARAAVRALKKAGPLPRGGVVVEIRAGTYVLDEPLVLTAEDSGAPGSPVTWRAERAGAVRLVGGRTVTRWRAVTEAKVLSVLPAEARGHVVQADLKAAGIPRPAGLTRRGFGEPVRPAHAELFFDDRPMTPARWPNDGYARIASLPGGKNSRTFGYSGDRPARWVNEPEVWVYGYWYHDWADTYMKVEKIDTARRTITTRAPAHRYGLRKSARWMALNALSELDAPGEYYIDRAAGVLYFYPPGPVDSARALVSVAEGLILMKDASHVTIRGLTLEACRGTAVRIDGGEGCRVAACTVRNVGNHGVVVSGRGHAVVGCDIYQTGDGGVRLSGGDRRTLSPGALLAENNHIHHFSRWSHTYRPAVAVGGCGNRVRHNLIHDGPHNAIQLGGNDHLVEFNEIHHVCTDTGDVGAYYMGRDWTARGTVIRHNFFHDISGPGRLGAMGVYLDDQASGIRIEGNVFRRVTRAVFIGGGCDNIVENNIFVDCTPAVHIDARGLGWQKKATDDPKGTLRTRLAAMPVSSPLWAKRYPNLPGILADDPGTPKRNRVVRNICVGGRWDDIHAGTRKFQIIEDNLVGRDPLFVDAARGDYRLRADSPAWKLGFRAIPLEKIGLYAGADRASPVPGR